MRSPPKAGLDAGATSRMGTPWAFFRFVYTKDPNSTALDPTTLKCKSQISYPICGLLAAVAAPLPIHPYAPPPPPRATQHSAAPARYQPQRTVAGGGGSGDGGGGGGGGREQLLAADAVARPPAPNCGFLSSVPHVPRVLIAALSLLAVLAPAPRSRPSSALSPCSPPMPPLAVSPLLAALSLLTVSPLLAALSPCSLHSGPAPCYRPARPCSPFSPLSPLLGAYACAAAARARSPARPDRCPPPRPGRRLSLVELAMKVDRLGTDNAPKSCAEVPPPPLSPL